MGNRVNYGFKSNGHVINLYLHWGPEEVEKTLAQALDKTRRRWDDEPYAIRWTVLNLLNDMGDLDLAETGSGLSIDYLPDNENKVYVVDFAKQRVTSDDELWSLDGFIDEFGD